MHTEKTRRGTVLAAIVHDTLNAETFDMVADLIEAVKTRAARLRIPYDATAITEALAAVGRTRPLLRVATAPPQCPPDHLFSEDPPVPRELAGRIMADLKRRNPALFSRRR